jgi:hypothetical protein
MQTEMNTTNPRGPVASGAGAARAPRDLRLDFFRGMAMFIILLAHTPGNPWTLWIPARFGFSDATEIFVFCSGMASSLAFGTLFIKRGFFLGTARIAFRVWQVYWAHIGIFLATAMLSFSIDHFGIGLPDKRYVFEPFVVPFFTRTGEAVLGLMTLTYVPGMFDILPMYLVILAMVPVVMLLYRTGGRWAVFGAMLLVWLAANLAGYVAMLEPEAEIAPWESALIAAGGSFDWMNLPSNPFGEGTWFFNPFAWQLIFFTGFAFGMRWIPAPPVNRWLVIAASAYLLLVLPFAWFKIHQGFYLPQEWALTDWVRDTRAALEPAWWKSWIGGLRYLHFLALAYLAWAAVGAGGRCLSEGFRPRAAAPVPVLAGAAIIVLISIPYTYIDEIKLLSPALDAWFFENIPLVHGNRIGLIQLVHLTAAIVLIWAAIGARGRQWLARDLVKAAVPVIRKVGTQSLAVFMISIPLARLNGWLLDMIGRDPWSVAFVNLSGFAALIFTAYSVSWFKSQPWRARGPGTAAADASATQGSGADGRGRPRLAAMRA